MFFTVILAPVLAVLLPLIEGSVPTDPKSDSVTKPPITAAHSSNEEPQPIEEPSAQIPLKIESSAKNRETPSGLVVAVPRTTHRPTPEPHEIPIGWVYNPDSGTDPKHPVFFRPALPVPIDEVTTTPLNYTLEGLPIIGGDEPRSMWSEGQRRVASILEQKTVHTVVLPRASSWSQKPSGSAMHFLVTAGPTITARIRMVLPGAYLPAEIDLPRFRRIAANGIPMKVSGHLFYDGSKDILESVGSGQLLSPWGVIIRHLWLREPSGTWTRITNLRP